MQERRCRLIWQVAEENIAEEIAQLRRENQELKAENERLRRLLEEALRASKRQAAPFSRHKPKAQPQKPGRKSGPKYGRRCRRPVPERIDEVVEVPLPAQCPRCGGGLEEGETVSQFQTEIPEPDTRVQQDHVDVVRIHFQEIFRKLSVLPTAGARPASAADLECTGQCGLTTGATSVGAGHATE